MNIFNHISKYALLTIVMSSGLNASEIEPIIIGLDADMSAGAARGGLAIQRGAEIAINEINDNGGVLGRPLLLESKDHRGNPARGLDNIKSFASRNEVVAVLGGVHTPVAMHELEAIHDQQLIYLGPWAAGTPIVNNGYSPNYVFRVSIRDEFAGAYLVGEALKKGYRKIALALEKTGWGRSNEKAMKMALAAEGLDPTEIAWFHWGAQDMETAVKSIAKTSPDVILLVANTPEGLAIVRSIASLPKADRIPIISHWGITGGSFFEQAKDVLGDVDLSILQTYSFIKPSFPDRANKVINAYLEQYSDATDVQDIFAPTGTAHAYDIIQILALAIKKANTTNRQSVRNALENLTAYNGLVRDYSPPFSAEKHDALDASDFRLSTYDEKGVIVPLK
ncbi:MAG: ABC transporter substrate-binding protein [Gammaproteobacteria bacterium]|nr:ABC transporter substrate-binding protein [Gammaproteobacteria bacterium]